MNETVRKGAALVVVFVTIMAADVALGHDHRVCYTAYLESGLTAQQMSFDQFRHTYGDTLCAPEGGLQAAHEARAAQGRDERARGNRVHPPRETEREVQSGAARFRVAVQAQSI